MKKAVKKQVRQEVARDVNAMAARRRMARPPVAPRALSGRSNLIIQKDAMWAMTTQERWEADLIYHIGHPMSSYPLPGIDTTGVSFVPGFDAAGNWPGGRDTAGTHVNFTSNPFNGNMVAITPSGGTVPIRQAEMDRQMESRYYKFDGWVQNRLDCTTASGEWNMVIGFNPLDPVNPIVSINFPDGAPAFHEPTTSLPWTASPYITASHFADTGGAPWPSDQSVGRDRASRPPQPTPHSRDSSSDRWTSVSGDSRRPAPVGDTTLLAPIVTYDAANYYWVGGAEMVVKIVGYNAFTAFSALARDDATTIPRFWTAEDDPTDGNTFDYGSLVQHSPGHNVGYAAYTGSKWSLAMSNTSPSDQDWQKDRLRLILNTGMPFVHFKYSVPTGSSTVPYIQVTASTWMAVAPTTLRFAGAAPHATLPFDLPPWASYCRARGCTSRDENAARVGAATNGLSRLGKVPSNSRIVNAVARNPAGAAKTISTAAKVGRAATSVISDIVGLVPGGKIAGMGLKLGYDAITRQGLFERPAPQREQNLLIEEV